MALWTCVVLLLVARLLLGFGIRDGQIADLSRGFDIHLVTLRLESLQQGSVDTLLLGNSRFHSAVLPAVWEAEAGLPRGAIELIAINSGRLWDYAQILRKAGGLPASVRHVVVELAPWEFNRNLRNSLSKEIVGVPVRVRSDATFAERWVIAGDATTRISLLGDWLWPLHARRTLPQWSRAFGRPELLRPPALRRWPGHADPATRDRIANAPHRRGARMALDHFHEPAMSGLGTVGLERLLEQLPESEVRITFLQLPYQRSYLGTIRENPSRNRLYEDVHALFRAREGGNIDVSIFETAQELNLEDRVFLDYGHFDHVGAVEVTRALARRFRGNRR